MRYQWLLFLLLVHCLIPITSIGQGEYYNKNDLSYYFEDGGVTTSRSLLKLDFFSAAVGNPALNFEYQLGKRLSTELSLGITGLYFSRVFNAFIGYTNINLITPHAPGYSFSVQPRLYYRSNEGFYNGFKYRYRTYRAEVTTESIERHEFLFYSGFTERYNNRFVNDLSLGFGFLLERSRLVTGLNNRFGFALSLGFKPGLWL